MSSGNAHTRHFVCRCFYTHNYYSKIANRHFQFVDKANFMQKNDQLRQDGDLLERVACELEEEQKRRKSLGDKSKERRKIITEKYVPRHPHVYTLKESFFDHRFLELVKASKEYDPNKRLPGIEPMKGERIFAFPVFTPEFCKDFLEELQHFEASPLPKGRPNTMNKYGVRQILLDELGLDPDFFIPLRRDFLSPIASILFPDHGGSTLDSHKAFTVQYRADPQHDVDLGYHYDNAEVTLNVSLGQDFEEGSLYFGPMREEASKSKTQNFTECTHRLGYGILHRGQHMHGALPISEGERNNLIIWMRSSTVRNKLCPMCQCEPVLIETTGQGDGFTQQDVQVCNVT